VTSNESFLLIGNYFWMTEGLSLRLEVRWPRVVLPWFGLVFFRLFFGFFVTENAVIDITIQEMVTNIASLYTFQI
jgi:hypothetical protein